MEMAESPSKEELIAQLKALQKQCEHERRRSEGLEQDLKHAKEHNIAVQKQVEQEEEYITNKLMKRLEQLKKEKAILATEVEQEEEFLTNTLQKRLEKLTQEKVDLENRLEAEQEYIVNKLRKQLEQLTVEKTKLFREKIDLENQLEAEQEYILNKLQKQVDKLGSEKKNLQKEKSDLQRQVTDLAGAVDKLNQDKVNLENQMEMEEENIVNKLQRQLEGLLHSLRTVEQKLEAKGLSLRDLGLGPGDLSPEWTRIYSRSPSSTGSIERALSGAAKEHQLATMGAATGFLSGNRRERPLSAVSNSLTETYAKV